jgi:hypothetical protein
VTDDHDARRLIRLGGELRQLSGGFFEAPQHELLAGCGLAAADAEEQDR